MEPDEVLGRISATLREQVGPEIADPFARTQAYMAAVVLEKLAGQISRSGADAAADEADRRALGDDLVAMIGSDAPAPVTAAIAALPGSGTAVAELVAALYSERAHLGPERFDALLGRVRRTMRAGLERRLQYSA